MTVAEPYAHLCRRTAHCVIAFAGERCKHACNVFQAVYGDADILFRDERRHCRLAPYNDGYAGAEVERCLMRVVYLEIFSPCPGALVGGVAVPHYSEVSLYLCDEIFRGHEAVIVQVGVGTLFRCKALAVEVEGPLARDVVKLIQEVVVAASEVACVCYAPRVRCR